MVCRFLVQGKGQEGRGGVCWEFWSGVELLRIKTSLFYTVVFYQVKMKLFLLPMIVINTMYTSVKNIGTKRDKC